MRLSFGDESSMAEVSNTESLPFTAAAADSIPETESISMVDQEQRSDDIEIQSRYYYTTISNKYRWEP